ncbi:MAG: hypothetical protein AABY42_07640 [Nitrospirota bacterium]
MDNSVNRGMDTLSEFQKYLLDKKLVPEAKVSFFAYWVSRFLNYAQRHDVMATEYQESNIAAFIDDLRLDNFILDWQPRQAEDALKLYYFH